MPGLHINGVRATIARYPNQPGGVEHSCMGKCVVDQGDVAWTPANFAKLGNSTSYTDRTPQHKRNDSASGWSQYDNWFAHYMLGIGGACQVYDPPVSYWCNLNASGGRRVAVARGGLERLAAYVLLPLPAADTLG